MRAPKATGLQAFAQVEAEVPGDLAVPLFVGALKLAYVDKGGSLHYGLKG
jgi:hypothetical protein